MARKPIASILLLVAALCVLVPGGHVQAQTEARRTVAGPGMRDELLGGQPPAGSAPSVKDFDYWVATSSRLAPGVSNLDGAINYFYLAGGVTPAMEAKMVGQGSQ